MATREFEGFGRFGQHLGWVATRINNRFERGLKQIGREVTKAARDKIGNRQTGFDPGDGNDPFPDWAPLKPSTLDEKERLGYSPPDNPLLREGDLRKSYSWEVGGTYKAQWVRVGSPSMVAFWHEFGTRHMASRPVVGPAMAERMPENVKILLDGLRAAFAQ